ncbi:MAG: hypothetical protein ACYCZN_01905 [Candidatus Dormibacteria bacterium]
MGALLALWVLYRFGVAPLLAARLYADHEWVGERGLGRAHGMPVHDLTAVVLDHGRTYLHGVRLVNGAPRQYMQLARSRWSAKQLALITAYLKKPSYGIWPPASYDHDPVANHDALAATVVNTYGGTK